MIGAVWDIGHFDESEWDTLVVSGAITEDPDSAAGAVQVRYGVSGAITEASDVASGNVARVISVQGEIAEDPDVTDGYIGVRGAVTGDITENPDTVYGRVQVKYAYRGGWAPQFNYKREWEKEPDVVVEEEVVLEVLEPEFIPTPQPIDPAVARMIEAMLRGPEQIDSDEDDIAAILMEM
jgi:hypothetical protein